MGRRDRIEPTPHVGRMYRWAAVTDIQTLRFVLQHGIQCSPDSRDILGEKMAQRVLWSNPAVGETAPEKVTDHGIAVVEQHNARTRGVTGDRYHLSADAVFI